MKTKTAAMIMACILAASGMARAQETPSNKPAPEPIAVDPAEVAATYETVSRALYAIPLVRVTSGARILPFIGPEGQAIAIEKPLLAFQILPFPDSRGNWIPILKTGPAILPFVDASGEPIPIGKARHIEPISQ